MAEYPGIDPSPWVFEHLDALCNMGFKREDVEDALRENNGVYSDALQWLVITGCTIEGMDSDDEIDIDDLNPVLLTSNDVTPFRDIVRQVLHGQPEYVPNTQQEIQKIQNQEKLKLKLKDVIDAGYLDQEFFLQPLGPETVILCKVLREEIDRLKNFKDYYKMTKSIDYEAAARNEVIQIERQKQRIYNLQVETIVTQDEYMRNLSPQDLLDEGYAESDDEEYDDGLPDGAVGGEYGQGYGESPGDIVTLLEDIHIRDPAPGSKLLNLFGGNTSEEMSMIPNANEMSASSLRLDRNDVSSNIQGTIRPSTSQCEKPDNDTDSIDWDALGIVEFFPGKPWKGLATRNTSMDSTLTPGSVAPNLYYVPSQTPHNNLGLTESTLGSNTSSTNHIYSSSNFATLNNPLENLNLPQIPSVNDMTLPDVWGESQLAASVLVGQPTFIPPIWIPPDHTYGASGQSSFSSSNPVHQEPRYGLLRNLTPRIDHIVLQTICGQNGTVIHHDPQYGIAMLMFSNKLEVTEALSFLNSNRIGNTLRIRNAIIEAEIVEERDIQSVMRSIYGPGTSLKQSPYFTSGSDYSS